MHNHILEISVCCLIFLSPLLRSLLLFVQISSCDNILARMEGLLTSFQTDLGSISSEILSLQQQSVEMNLRLVPNLRIGFVIQF